MADKSSLTPELCVVTAGQQFLDAKIREFSAYTIIESAAGMKLAREQAHDLLDAYLDAILNSVRATKSKL